MYVLKYKTIFVSGNVRHNNRQASFQDLVHFVGIVLQLKQPNKKKKEYGLYRPKSELFDQEFQNGHADSVSISSYPADAYVPNLLITNNINRIVAKGPAAVRNHTRGRECA